jgi:hypothetical protein
MTIARRGFLSALFGAPALPAIAAIAGAAEGAPPVPLPDADPTPVGSGGGHIAWDLASHISRGHEMDGGYNARLRMEVKKSWSLVFRDQIAKEDERRRREKLDTLRARLNRMGRAELLRVARENGAPATLIAELENG